MRTFQAGPMSRGLGTTLAWALMVTALAAPPAGAQSQCYTGPPPPNSEGPPADMGFWEPIVDVGVEAIHSINLPTGKVLVWGRQSTGARLYDPATGDITFAPAPISAFFCSGHAHLADGRVLVAGGLGIGGRTSAVYDPWTNTWGTPVPTLAGHYYPTLTTLEDGRVFTASGIGGGSWFPEIYDPTTNAWSRIGCAPDCLRTPVRLHFYPRTSVGPDGSIFMAPASRTMFAYSLNEEFETFTQHAIGHEDDGKMTGAPAVYFATGKLLRAGVDTYHAGKSSATGATAVIDFNDITNPIYRDVAPMAYARNRNNLTLLADGTVLSTGGDRRSVCLGGDRNVYNAEIWDPATETWTTVGAMQVPRVYHSTAVLLRDGSVLSGGGEVVTTSQIFRPPYLFRGPRPTIAAAPAVVTYGASFAIDTPDAATITQVNLLHLGSVTHAYDQSQRIVRLAFTAGSNQLTVTGPLDGYEAAPGYYMLFLISNQGVPSVAEFVRVTI